jgi:iron complex transport system substrate-binding protein
VTHRRIPARSFLGALLCLALCAPGIALAATPAVTDAAGRHVILPAPARRIVALAPHIVENLYSIGAGAQIVGAVDYSDYPAGAEKIPRVGGIAGISLERIVALQPDLVVGWQSGTDSRVIAAVDELAIPYYLDEIRSLEDLRRSLTHLGLLTGRSDGSVEAVRTLRLAVAAHAGTGYGERPTVFLQLWDQPLQSVGAQHLLTDVIERCGGSSVTASVPGLAPRIELEAVLAADPDLIIVESTEQAGHWSRFPDLTALRADRIHAINPDLMHRPTLRLLQGMRVICKHIDEARTARVDRQRP